MRPWTLNQHTNSMNGCDKKTLRVSISCKRRLEKIHRRRTKVGISVWQISLTFPLGTALIKTTDKYTAGVNTQPAFCSPIHYHQSFCEILLSRLSLLPPFSRHSLPTYSSMQRLTFVMQPLTSYGTRCKYIPLPLHPQGATHISYFSRI